MLALYRIGFGHDLEDNEGVGVTAQTDSVDRLIVLGVLIGAASLALASILQVWPSDPSKLLGRRAALFAGVMPPMQMCSDNPPSERWAREYRISSWKEDFDSVAEAAERELAGLGFRRVPSRSAKEYWGDFENERADD